MYIYIDIYYIYIYILFLYKIKTVTIIKKNSIHNFFIYFFLIGTAIIM